MQTAAEASSVASKLSRVARFDPVKLVQKCIIQSPESGSSCFNWLGLGIESLIARAYLLPRRTTRFCTHTITTTSSTNVTTIATAVTDHCHRQSFLSLSRPSQQITASTNARDTSHRGRTDRSHRQYYLSLSHPSQ
jgi:hypothetical protein